MKLGIFFLRNKLKTIQQINHEPIQKERRKEMETVRPRGTDKAKVIEVIQTESIIGRGIPEDPVRLIYQYWDFKGNLLAKNDTLNDDEVTFSR